MSEITVSFKNYKLLKEGEINLSDGSIFFVQGPNDVGKTSFLNLLRAIMEVKDETKNPVTFGEKEGFATGKIVGADGLTYQFRYDFNVDGKKKFQFIDPEGKVIKSITDMRAIFNYTHFTVEEFFNWSTTVPGRKKQRDIFMMLLDDKERQEIMDIDAKVNPLDGEMVESRKNVNKEADFLKKRIDATIITPDMKGIYDKKDEINKLFSQLNVTKEKLTDELASTEVFKERHDSLTKEYEVYKETFNDKSTSLNNEITSIEEQIKQLNERLVEKKNDLLVLHKGKTEKDEDYTELIKKLESSFDPIAVEQKRQELIKVKERIQAGEQTKEQLIRIIELITNKAKEEKEYEIKIKEVESYNENIETLRNRKKDIIFNSQNIPAGWSLDDDSITIDNIPFVETYISKSKATKAIATLMMKINQSPIMFMGDAESIGFPILNELDDFAKANNKILLFAEHVREASELQLVCYDDIEHEVTKTKKDLF